MGCGAATLREYALATPDEIYDITDDSVVLPSVEECAFVLFAPFPDLHN
jgi:hypothetical protein